MSCVKGYVNAESGFSGYVLLSVGGWIIIVVLFSFTLHYDGFLSPDVWIDQEVEKRQRKIIDRVNLWESTNKIKSVKREVLKV